jgi:hypothetical protein
MQWSGTREAVNAAKEEYKKEQARAQQASENLNNSLNESRSKGSKSPDKGFFKTMFGNFKNALDGWSSKYDSKQKAASTIENNYGYEPISDVQRKKLTIKKAQEANTSIHSAKEVAKNIDEISENIRIEKAKPGEGNFNLVLRLQDQLKKWEGMQDKINESLLDKSEPNTKRHERAIYEIKLGNNSFDLEMKNKLAKIENLSEEARSEDESKFLESFNDLVIQHEIDSANKLLDSYDQTTTENINFPSEFVDGKEKSLLTREVYEKYNNFSVLELGDIINNNPGAEDVTIKEIQSMILYKTRNPFNHQTRDSEGQLVYGKQGEKKMQANLEGSDYEIYAKANNIPFKPTKLAKVEEAAVKPVETAPSQTKVVSEKSPITKQEPSSQDSILNKTVSTLFSQVGEVASINFEKGRNLLGLLGRKVETPKSITKEYAASLSKKFESISYNEATKILNQLEKENKLGALAELCTKEQAAVIREYCTYEQSQQLQDYVGNHGVNNN